MAGLEGPQVKRNIVILLSIVLEVCYLIVESPSQICNSNITEWSTIQGIIGRVISLRDRFEITSAITPELCYMKSYY